MNTDKTQFSIETKRYKSPNGRTDILLLIEKATLKKTYFCLSFHTFYFMLMTDK